MPVEAEILVPQEKDRHDNEGDNYKVMILLHGANWNSCEWLLKSNIYDLVREQPIVVFMPSAKNSFYVNTYNGYNYMDYITMEIPDFIKKHFRVSNNRKDWLIAGESMGGFGATVCGFNAVEQFGNIANFSGALDIASDAISLKGIDKGMLFGPDLSKIKNSNLDVYSLCHRLDKSLRPNIFMNCGKQDSLYEMNVRFYEEIKDEYDVVCTLDKDGAHDFNYWNERLKELIPWFLKVSGAPMESEVAH